MQDMFFKSSSELLLRPRRKYFSFDNQRMIYALKGAWTLMSTLMFKSQHFGLCDGEVVLIMTSSAGDSLDTEVDRLLICEIKYSASVNSLFPFM